MTGTKKRMELGAGKRAWILKIAMVIVIAGIGLTLKYGANKEKVGVVVAEIPRVTAANSNNEIPAIGGDEARRMSRPTRVVGRSVEGSPRNYSEMQKDSVKYVNTKYKLHGLRNGYNAKMRGREKKQDEPNLYSKSEKHEVHGKGLRSIFKKENKGMPEVQSYFYEESVPVIDEDEKKELNYRAVKSVQVSDVQALMDALHSNAAQTQAPTANGKGKGKIIIIDQNEAGLSDSDIELLAKTLTGGGSNAPPPEVTTQNSPAPEVVTQTAPAPEVVTQKVPPPEVVTQKVPPPEVVTQKAPEPEVITQKMPAPENVTQKESTSQKTADSSPSTTSTSKESDTSNQNIPSIVFSLVPSKNKPKLNGVIVGSDKGPAKASAKLQDT